jgi:hypothetical protein
VWVVAGIPQWWGAETGENFFIGKLSLFSTLIAKSEAHFQPGRKAATTWVI